MFRTKAAAIRGNCTLARGLALVLLVGAAILAWVNLHAAAHVLAARVGGVGTATYHLYRTSHGRLVCIGCKEYTEDGLSDGWRFFVEISGVLATQVAALCFAAMSKRRRRGSVSQTLWLVLSLAFLMDFLIHSFQSITGLGVTQSNRVDFLNAINLVTAKTDAPLLLLKIVVGMFTIGYVGLFLRALRIPIVTNHNQLRYLIGTSGLSNIGVWGIASVQCLLPGRSGR